MPGNWFKDVLKVIRKSIFMTQESLDINITAVVIQYVQYYSKICVSVELDIL